MSELADLYQRVVIDHNRAPRNFRALSPHSHRAEGYNPLCGDRVEVFLDIRDGVIQDVSFQGDACAIATASASLLTDTLLGRGVEEALAIARRFEAELGGAEDEQSADLGDLSALLAVRNYPGRDKCARLAWRALDAALNGEENQSVTTEPST